MTNGAAPKRRLWHCERCRQVLGEIVAGRLIIVHNGRELVIDGHIEQRCHRCGAVSELKTKESA